MAAPRKPTRREQLQSAVQSTHEHSTNTVQTQHKSSTDNTQAQYKRSTTDTQAPEKLQRYDVRLAPSDWERLGEIAAAEGTSRGAIIRRLIKKYLLG